MNRLTRKLLAGAAAASLLAGVAGIAAADTVSNNIDNTVDTTAEGLTLTAGGSTSTVKLRVVVDDNATDPNNGCNIGGPGAKLNLDASSSNTSVATVSQPADFLTCAANLDWAQTPAAGSEQSVTITPLAAGTTTITFAVDTANSVTKAGGVFGVTYATFTVTVNAATANTAPTVTVGGVAASSYNKGSVPAAVCNVVDAEDGNSSFAATLSAVTGPYASDGIGSQTASCSYTDGSGLTDTDSVTYSIVDSTAPEISYVLTPADPDGLNDWYIGVVTLYWTVTDVESPDSLAPTGCVDQNITADQVATEYSCSATSAGGSTGPVTVSIQRDATAPTASASASPAPNGNGWNNTDVTVSFAASNAGVSGLDSCSEDVVVSAETAATGQAVSGTCTDLAGNVSDAASVTVKLDKTAPTVDRVGGPAAQTYYIGLNTMPTAPTCSVDDDLSGPDLDYCLVTGFDTTLGEHTVSVTGRDLAGNEGTSDSVTFTIADLTLNGFFQPVDMNNVFNTVKGGSSVPLKFRVFAGAIEITDVGIVEGFSTVATTCSSGAPEDAVEVTSTGGTSLRYDTTGGQFIQNWQTPKRPGTCVRVTLTLDGGVNISANFKLK